MGVCRCRTATNLYCFVHRKHVCYSCLSKDHTNCVVRTYLRWLADSDYEWPPKCQLCSNELHEHSTMRLMCLCTFHADCIHRFANNLPAHTAPAGYACPTCMTPLLPAADSGSQLAVQLSAAFENAEWAVRLRSNSPLTPSSVAITVDAGDQSQTLMSTASSSGTGGNRKKSARDSVPEADTLPIADADKYRKRGGLSRSIMRTLNLPEPAAGTVVNMKKIILFTVVGMLFAGFVILLMLRKKPRH